MPTTGSDRKQAARIRGADGDFLHRRQDSSQLTAQTDVTEPIWRRALSLCYTTGQGKAGVGYAGGNHGVDAELRIRRLWQPLGNVNRAAVPLSLILAGLVL